MKSTTYITEITNQKNEKCLWGEIQLLARFFASLPCVNYEIFPHEFTEKCFAIFDKSSRRIYLTWYQPRLLFWEFSSVIPFMVWL